MNIRSTRRQPYQVSLATAIALALSAILTPVQAQTPPQAPPESTPPPVAPSSVERIEVTGSIIRRVADMEALPVTILRAEELNARGQTELKDMMLELPQAAGLGTNAGSAGPLLSLRGFGAPRTLVLLNGRRLALEPLRNQYVPLTVMPQIALDRTEILRDGASASYGSDAMAGVTNFITKKSFTGGYVYGQTIQPERSGGGETTRGGFMYGVGDLGKDGWNVYAALDASRRSILYHRDRPELIDPSVLNSLGIATAITNGSSSSTPANILNAGANRTTAINPYASTGCLPRVSTPSGVANNQQCYVNTRDDLNPFSQGFLNKNLYVKGTMRLSGDHQITAEINHADVLTRLDQSSLVRAQYKVAPQVLNTGSGLPVVTNGVVQLAINVPMTIPFSSRFYPGKGIVPAVVGATGQPLVLNWGVTELGNRVRDDTQYNSRMVVTDEGRIGDWEYRAGLNAGSSIRDVAFGTGIVSESGFANGINMGILNPFGLQDVAGKAYLESISMKGVTHRKLFAWNRSADLTVSRDLMNMAGGPLTVAAGAEFRRDQFRAEGNDAGADAMFETPFLANLNPALPLRLPNGTATTGFAPYNSQAHRNIMSLFAEVEIPVLKNVSLNVSVRGDKYRDAGEGRYAAQTVNPKVGFRYEPTKGVMLRGSYNTGFRAPSMVELYQNLTEVKVDVRFDDPLLCPGGTIAGTGGGFTGGTAVANLPPGVLVTDVCKTGNATAASPNLGYATQLPNNSKLKEEKSRNYTFGIALEPIPNLTLTADYWNMHITDVVSSVAIKILLDDPVKFSSLYLRNPNGTLLYVLATQQNLGGLRAEGIDASASYMFPNTSIGRFRAGIDAVYLMHWASQIVPGGPWLEQVGIFNPGVDPNFGISGRPQMNYRWKYTATASWDHGPWKAQLSARYNGKYLDQNNLARISPLGGVPRDISPYKQFNLVTSYTGVKDLKLTFGINNLFNVNPPLTNNATYSDGYLLTNADVLGRAFNLKAEYNF